MATKTAEQKAHRERAKGLKKKMRYVDSIPRSLSEGRVLVHNHITPRPSLGFMGFRAWTEELSDELEVCDCDWAGVDLHGLKHYRTKGSGS